MTRFNKLCLLSANSTMMPCYLDNLERESLLPQPLSVGRQRSKRLPRSPSQPRSLLHQHDRKLQQPPPSNPLLLVRKVHPLAKQLHPLVKPLLHLDNKHLRLVNHHHQKSRHHHQIHHHNHTPFHRPPQPSRPKLKQRPSNLLRLSKKPKPPSPLLRNIILLHKLCMKMKMLMLISPQFLLVKMLLKEIVLEMPVPVTVLPPPRQVHRTKKWLMLLHN